MQGARMPRRSRTKSAQKGRRSRLRGMLLRVTAIAFVAAVLTGGYFAWIAASEFEGRRWDIPAQVYAAPLELYAGRAFAAEDLVA
jgi:penicillin-binding protein 1B